MKVGEDKNHFIWFYTKYFKRQKAFLLLVLALIVVGVGIGNIGPLLYGRMIDLITTAQISELKKYIVIYFSITVGAIALSIAETYAGQFLTFKVTQRVKTDLLEKIIRMRFQKLDHYTIGELISRLESDAGAIVEYYINFVTSIMLIVFNLVISIYFVIQISPQLSFVSAFYVPMAVLNTVLFKNKYRALATKQKDYSDRYFGFINETFSNIKGIRSYQMEKWTVQKFKGFIQENFALLKRSMLIGNISGVISQMVSLCFTLVLIYLSALLILNGQLTIGSMVAFNTYNDKLFDAVSRIMNLNLNAQSVIVCLDRIKKMDEEPCETEESRAELDAPIHHILMNHVDFGYSSDVPVLRDVSLSIAKPGLYCFVGQNGCGKSTLVKLLLRFYDYNAGSIRYNDIDMMDLSMAEIRRNYTYIAKEPFILKDTLLNNILLADAHQLPEEVKRACERAGLAAYVGSLPEGYDTVLNEGGSSLSSGQKQKINMARMMIKKTPVYILDEVTSDLDGVAEKEIMGIIREVAQSAIVLFITHRAAPLMECDRIYVMSEGHIVADGTHAELLDQNELYREMFARKQSKEDDDEPQT